LLHGLGASAYSFRLNRPELSQSFRVVTIELAGHGYSDRSAPDLSMTAQADYVAGLLDQVGIESAIFIGHSLGGSVAQRVAAARPEKVAGLVLIASTTDEFMGRAAWAGPALSAFIPTFLTAVLHNHVVRPHWHRLAVYDPAYLTPDVTAAYAAPGHVRGHAAAYQQLMRDRRRDARLDLGRIVAPTLIVWGDTDRIVRIGHGRRLERGIAGSRLVVVPRAGHWLPEERPDVVNAMIGDFAASLKTPTASIPR
jgi:pimeloyl-ACP methyl ester carboxylesterase